jgi:hypothetical protein
MSDKKGSKKYTTYLGLVDSGSSGMLVNKEIVEYVNLISSYRRNQLSEILPQECFKLMDQ